MVGALSTTGNPQDREIRFIFGETLQKFMAVWLSATLAPVTFHASLAAVLTAVVGPLHIDMRLDDSEGLYLGILFLGYLVGLCCVTVGSQWWVLRRRLPHAGRWAVMTVAGAFAGVIVSELPFGWEVNGSTKLVDPTGALHGILFGFGLGAVQSRALAEPFKWHHRFQWIVASVFAGGLASSVGLWAHEMLLVLVPRGHLFRLLDIIADLLVWALYFLPTGIAMHRLLIWTRRTQTGHLAARFD